jgi:hypothetical protein
MFWLEISPCRQDPDGIDFNVTDAEAEFFGVYRRPDARLYESDPEALAEWLADFPSLAEAKAFRALLEALDPAHDCEPIDGFEVLFDDVRNDDHDPSDPDSEEGWRVFDVAKAGRACQLPLAEQEGCLVASHGEPPIPIPADIMRRLVGRARALGYDD